MRETIARARGAIDAAQVESARAIRLLAAEAGPPRRCARCGGRLSVYADRRDRYCAPCHPKAEPRPGRVLATARWAPAPDDRQAAHDAAVELGHRGARGRA